jgi:hypothetical protein
MFIHMRMNGHSHAGSWGKCQGFDWWILLNEAISFPKQQRFRQPLGPPRHATGGVSN